MFFERMALLAVLPALLLLACQPYPRPFEDQAKDQNDLLRLANRGGVVVLPIEGSPNASGFSEAIAAELRRLDVPATTRVAGGGALRLGGRIDVAPRDALRDQVTIGWRLSQPDGTVLAGRTGSWLVQRDAWLRGDTATLSAIAQLAAPELGELIEGDRPVTQPGPPLIVWAVDGAPGDGSVTLKAAMERALRRAGYRVLTELADEALVVSGAVTVEPAGAGRQRVTIAWSVLDTDGAELGQVNQENVVAAGLLDGPWGEIARQIATAALEGIGEVIDQPRAKPPG